MIELERVAAALVGIDGQIKRLIEDKALPGYEIEGAVFVVGGYVAPGATASTGVFRRPSRYCGAAYSVCYAPKNLLRSRSPFVANGYSLLLGH